MQFDQPTQHGSTTMNKETTATGAHLPSLHFQGNTQTFLQADHLSYGCFNTCQSTLVYLSDFPKGNGWKLENNSPHGSRPPRGTYSDNGPARASWPTFASAQDNLHYHIVNPVSPQQLTCPPLFYLVTMPVNPSCPCISISSHHVLVNPPMQDPMFWFRPSRSTIWSQC